MEVDLLPPKILRFKVTIMTHMKTTSRMNSIIVFLICLEISPQAILSKEETAIVPFHMNVSLHPKQNVLRVLK